MHSSFLKYFDEVARQKSIRKAAAILNISSTTVNRKIIAIEQDMGAKLFERTAEGVELTTIGKMLLEHCRRTLHDYEQTKVLMDDLRDRRTGHITLQTLDSAAYDVLPKAIEKFKAAFPDITLSITTAMPDDIVAAVADGAADIGITFMRALHPNVRIIAEKAAPFGAVMRPDHPLAQHESITITDLSRFRLIRTTDARGRNSIIDQLLSHLATPLSTHFYTNSLSIAKRMIFENQGIGLYTKIGFYTEIEQGKMVFVPLIAEGLRDIKIGLIVSASVGMDPVKMAIYNAISRELKPLRLDS